MVWRRLEPGDARTPGSELAPESEHLEAKIIEVAIGAELFTERETLWAKRDEVTAIAARWTTRYEPAGVLFTIGGSMALGIWLDYLPPSLLAYAGSLVVLGAAVGVFTRARKRKMDREAARRWKGTSEERALRKIERDLRERWERFATRLREDTGFRADLRVGDIHEADRLVSIDPALLTHPRTWRADDEPNQVRYAEHGPTTTSPGLREGWCGDRVRPAPPRVESASTLRHRFPSSDVLGASRPPSAPSSATSRSTSSTCARATRSRARAARASPRAICWSSTRSTWPSTSAPRSRSWSATLAGCGASAPSSSRTSSTTSASTP